MNLPLVVIAGPTASGKTSLAIKIAREFNGEIICADSRSIYKYMDVGTAKPTLAEQAIVPHWGLDIVEPGEYYSVADFKDYALQKIDEIRARGHVPLLVGGTGLYVDAVVFDYQFAGKVDEALRTKLQQMSTEELQQHCVQHGIQMPENYKNKRYLERAIEKSGQTVSKCEKPIDNTIIVGIATDRQVLRERIEKRSEQILDDGVVDEARMLGEKYGWESEAMKSNIYPLLRRYLVGEITIDDVKRDFITLDYRLAKRQMTWLRRNSFIHWGSLSEVESYLAEQLALLR